MVTIAANCAAIRAENLPHHIRAISGIRELLPEVFLDLQDGVDSKAVDGIIRDESRNPSAVFGPHALALGLEIWQRDDPIPHPAFSQTFLHPGRNSQRGVGKALQPIQTQGRVAD
jgi:hypothetical protein